MKKIRLGLVGYGPWAKNYIKTIENMPNVELAALCRQKNERPDCLSPDCSFHTNWQDFHTLNGLKLDGVIVSSSYPNPIVMDYIYFGIPVMSEKPLLTDKCQIETLNLRSRGRKLLVNYIHLFNPAFQALKERIEGKKIIRICSSGFGPSKTREDFSPLWDYGVHDLALILSLINKEPTDVHINTHNKTKYGQTYRINLDFDGVKTKSIVGNGTIVKSRYLSVLFEEDNEERKIIFDDLAKNKLMLDNEPITNIDYSISSLQWAIEEFVAMIYERKIDNFYKDLTVKITKILSQYKEE